MTRAKPKPASPAERPLRLLSSQQLATRFTQALDASDGASGAHCIHERWMRGEMAATIDAALAMLWQRAAESIPDWLPTQFIECLPLVYDVAALFTPAQRGRSNIYLVLLDYRERAGQFGIYVGMTSHAPAQRFDQHKAGIRAAGSVLKRGMEVLTGPTLHLQRIRRAEAANIEEQLAEALRARGLIVQGGH